MSKQKTGLFRKEAVENASARTEANIVTHAVGLKFSLFTLALVICAALFAVWLIFGEVYETVSVNGIIWSDKDYGSVYTEYGGKVSKVTAERGSRVKTGDIIAIIPQEDILGEIEKQSSENLENLYDEYDKRSVVRSATDGIVTYMVSENAYVHPGDKIAEITPYDESGNNMTLTAFIPSDEGGLVSLGADVQVMLNFAPREKYGYINAYVSEISQYPVNGEYIRENMSELYMPSIEERNSYIRLEITLLADAETASRLKWSSPAGEGIDAPMGTVCTADIIVEKHHPYQWPF